MHFTTTLCYSIFYIKKSFLYSALVLLKVWNHLTGVEKVLNMDSILVFHAGTSLVDGCLVTNGGRVMAVVSLNTCLNSAASNATTGAAQITFEGAYFRKDIAFKALYKRYCKINMNNHQVYFLYNILTIFMKFYWYKLHITCKHISYLSVCLKN